MLENMGKPEFSGKISKDLTPFMHFEIKMYQASAKKLGSIAVFTCFCYVLMISLDHKKVRFSHFFQMCSKSFQINF